jgi:hypothetical protein
VIVRADPPYSPEALTRKLEGRVSFPVKVGADGKVLPGGYPIRGEWELASPALRTVRTWKFAPGAKETWESIEIDFRLDLPPAELFAFDGPVTTYRLGSDPRGVDHGKLEGFPIHDWSPIANPDFLPAIKGLLPKQWPAPVAAAGVRPPRAADWALEIRTQGERDVVLFASTRTGEVYLRDEDRAWTMKDPAFARALAAHLSTFLQ